MDLLAHCAFLGLIALSTASLIPADCSTHPCPIGERCVMKPTLCYYPPCDVLPTCEAAERPGTCPTPNNGLVGICVARCTTDNMCPPGMKCCGNCPRDCVYPDLQTVEKPGRCPPFPFFSSHCKTFRHRCDSDDECDGSYKCCRGGCGRICQRPILDEQLPLQQNTE